MKQISLFQKKKKKLDIGLEAQGAKILSYPPKWYSVKKKEFFGMINLVILNLEKRLNQL